MLNRVWILVDANGAKGAKADVAAALEAGFHTFVTSGDPNEIASLARVGIASVKDQERALALAGKHEAVLIDARAWKIIPHENLIAAYRGRGTKLLVEAVSVEEAKLLLETLERGVDVVL